MARHPFSLLLVCLLLLGVAAARGQAPVGRVLRPNAVWHTVADLDRTVAFYRDAVGLSPEPGPIDGRSDMVRPGHPGRHDADGHVVDSGRRRPPDARAVFGHCRFAGATAPPGSGSVKLVIRIRDMDAAFARVQGRVERVYTDGGMPMKPEGPAAVNRAVIMRDPDGYPLEFALQVRRR